MFYSWKTFYLKFENSLNFTFSSKMVLQRTELEKRFVIVIVIVISKLLKRYSKAKPPGHQLIHERCDESKGVSKGGSREAQVRIPEYQEELWSKRNVLRSLQKADMLF